MIKKWMKRIFITGFVLFALLVVIGIFASDDAPEPTASTETESSEVVKEEPKKQVAKEEPKKEEKKEDNVLDESRERKAKEREEESEYSLKLIPILDKSSDLMMEMGIIYTSMGNDESLFFDESVLERLRNNRDAVSANHDLLILVDPPAHLKDMHQRLIQASSKIVEAVSLSYDGVTNLDIDKINRAIVLQQEGNQQLNDVTAEFEKEIR